MVKCVGIKLLVTSVPHVQTWEFPVASVKNLKHKDSYHMKGSGEVNKTTNAN